jgi:hypothetical protein
LTDGVPISEEGSLPLIEVEGLKEKPTTADTLLAPPPSEDATSASAIPLVTSAIAQADDPTTNNNSEKTDLELVEKATLAVDGKTDLVVDGKTALELVDTVLDTPAPPYKADPDDEIILFTPGGKLWPIVMLEVILPSAYSKAPSDLATAPKGSNTRP